MNTHKRVDDWINDWKNKGYEKDIPDEVPDVLMKQNLAPSYKQIAIAILKNDMQMESLGYTAKYSEWYSYYKKIELAERIKSV